MQKEEKMGFVIRENWVQILTQPVTHCVSVSQVPDVLEFVLSPLLMRTLTPTQGGHVKTKGGN